MIHDGPLPGSTVAQVRAIAQAATTLDLVEPLGEQTLLDLTDPHAPVRHLLAGDPLTGYAALDLRAHPVAELVVAPDARRRGTGRALLDAARDASGSDRTPLVWAHGNTPAAQALAASVGLTVRRELWRMTARLPASPPSPALPDDVVVRPFVVGRDEAAWLEVNARAFADHPEQGRMTEDDLRARQREPWFSPDDLLLAERDGRLIGFAWLKIESVGELYVLGVDPDAQGTGLGRALTSLALSHLVRRGLDTAVLYTEAANDAAVHLYTAAGFVPARVDVQYG